LRKIVFSEFPAGNGPFIQTIKPVLIQQPTYFIRKREREMREKEGNKLDENADDFIKGDEDHFK
jgi:hypothetical protein